MRRITPISENDFAKLRRSYTEIFDKMRVAVILKDRS